MTGLGVTSFQLVLLLSLFSLGMSATVPESKKSDEGVVAAESSTHQKGVVPNKSLVVLAPHFPPSGLSREKRYIGWGRRPGLRYSKANSDFDTSFNKIYNRYEKRAQAGPEAPISNFRELRMKQKVPNAQLLLPHLFNRNNRPNDGEPQGSDIGQVELTEEDVETLLYLLEDYYAKNGRVNEK